MRKPLELGFECKLLLPETRYTAKTDKGKILTLEKFLAEWDHTVQPFIDEARAEVARSAARAETPETKP